MTNRTGGGYNEGTRFCSVKGLMVMSAPEKKEGKWQSARLVLGILLMVLCVVVLFQSCAVGLGIPLPTTVSRAAASAFCRL